MGDDQTAVDAQSEINAALERAESAMMSIAKDMDGLDRAIGRWISAHLREEKVPMTGIEKLRDYAEKLKETNRYDTIGMRIEAIVDQIERETLPKPIFEDGEPVDIGSYIGEVDGTDCGLTGEPVKRFEISAVHDSPGGEWAIRLEPGQVVKRPEPHDSWERIEDDAAKNVCDLVSEDECDKRTCHQCEVRLRLSLIRRSRALAEKEDGR